MKDEEVKRHLEEAQKHIVVAESNAKGSVLQTLLKATRLNIVAARLMVLLK